MSLIILSPTELKKSNLDSRLGSGVTVSQNGVAIPSLFYKREDKDARKLSLILRFRKGIKTGITIRLIEGRPNPENHDEFLVRNKEKLKDLPLELLSASYDAKETLTIHGPNDEPSSMKPSKIELPPVPSSNPPFNSAIPPPLPVVPARLPHPFGIPPPRVLFATPMPPGFPPPVLYTPTPVRIIFFPNYTPSFTSPSRHPQPSLATVAQPINTHRAALGPNFGLNYGYRWKVVISPNWLPLFFSFPRIFIFFTLFLL